MKFSNSIVSALFFVSFLGHYAVGFAQELSAESNNERYIFCAESDFENKKFIDILDTITYKAKGIQKFNFENSSYEGVIFKNGIQANISLLDLSAINKDEVSLEVNLRNVDENNFGIGTTFSTKSVLKVKHLRDTNVMFTNFSIFTNASDSAPVDSIFIKCQIGSFDELQKNHDQYIL